MYIGIDPGKKAGSIVMVGADGNSVVAKALVRWEFRARKVPVWLVWSSWYEDGVAVLKQGEVYSMSGVGAYAFNLFQRMVPLGTKFHTLCEDAFLGISPSASLNIAKYAGLLAATFELNSTEFRWLKATEWRAVLFTMSMRTTSDKAKEHAQQHALKMKGLRGLIEATSAGEHSFDAACVAETSHLISTRKGEFECLMKELKERRKARKKKRSSSRRGPKGSGTRAGRSSRKGAKKA